MHSLTLEQTSVKKQIGNFLRSGGITNMPAPSSVLTLPSALQEAHASLRDAEEVICAQGERIRQLESIALTDELTGVLNRRGFMMTLQREIVTSRRDKAAEGALVMVDLDRFKVINDTWGHSAGDHYLKAAADALSVCIRANDYVTRLGGDEFAVILTRISKKDAFIRAREIERDFNCQVVEWGNAAMPMRGSFGLALYGGHQTPDEVMAEADMKLYASKSERRAK